MTFATASPPLYLPPLCASTGALPHHLSCGYSDAAFCGLRALHAAVGTLALLSASASTWHHYHRYNGRHPAGALGTFSAALAGTACGLCCLVARAGLAAAAGVCLARLLPALWRPHHWTNACWRHELTWFVLCGFWRA